MAENEYLDVNRNLRWRRLMCRVEAGALDEEIISRLTINIWNTVKALGKRVPLHELLRAAAAGTLPHHDLRPWRCAHDYVELLTHVAVDTSASEPIGERFLEAIVDRALSQMGLELQGRGAVLTYDHFEERAAAWRRALHPVFQKLARKMMELPVAQLRLPPQPAEFRDNTETLTTMSLIARRTNSH